MESHQFQEDEESCSFQEVFNFQDIIKTERDETCLPAIDQASVEVDQLPSNDSFDISNDITATEMTETLGEEGSTSYNFIITHYESDPLSMVNTNQGDESHTSWSTYPWECTLCQQWPFLGYESLHQHMQTEHINENSCLFKCNDCKKTFDCYSVFLNHVRINHRSNWKLSCDICDRYFNDYEELRTHRSRENKNTSHPAVYLCSKCGRAYPRKCDFVNHYKLSHCHKCHSCSMLFATKINLENHIQNSHKLKCTICGIILTNITMLRDHQKTHVIRHKCEFCGDSFLSIKDHRAHVKEHYNPVKFKCKLCEMEFLRRFERDVHERSHLIQMYLCSRCSMKFESVEELKEHFASHEEVRYYCDICKKSFPLAYKFKNHMRLHQTARVKARRSTSTDVRKPACS